MTDNIKKAFAYLDPEHPTVRAALAEIEQQAEALKGAAVIANEAGAEIRALKERVAELEARSAEPIAWLTTYECPPSTTVRLLADMNERQREYVRQHANSIVPLGPVADSAMEKDAELLRELAALPRHDPNTVLKYDVKVLHVRGELLRRIDAAIAASAEKGDKA